MNARLNLPIWTSIGAILRRTPKWISIPCLLLALAAGFLALIRHQGEQRRAEWKVTTLPKLAGLSFTNADIQQELGRLHERVEWVGDRLLVMTNGESLLYAFRHGANNGWPDHLFLARSSSGRWYYSTFHFCNHMVGIMSDEPPGSMAEFTKRYSLREFDGKSDECLEHTWPK